MVWSHIAEHKDFIATHKEFEAVVQFIVVLYLPIHSMTTLTIGSAALCFASFSTDSHAVHFSASCNILCQLWSPPVAISAKYSKFQMRISNS